MALTRAIVDPLLLARIGELYKRIGKNGTTADGTNADLAVALGWALRRLGGTATTFGGCTNTDLATLPSNREDAFLDVAELRCLMDAQTSIVGGKITVGPVTEDNSTFAAQLAETIKAKQAAITRDYGSMINPPIDTDVEVELLAI